MNEGITMEILSRWSPNTISGADFSGELSGQSARIAPAASVTAIFVGSGAFTVAVGERIDDPLARPAIHVSTE
jgi:hypothetical protein